MGGCGLDLSDSGYYVVTGSCEHANEHQFPKKSWNFLTSRVTTSYSTRTSLHGVSVYWKARWMFMTHVIVIIISYMKFYTLVSRLMAMYMEALGPSAHVKRYSKYTLRGLESSNISTVR